MVDVEQIEMRVLAISIGVAVVLIGAYNAQPSRLRLGLFLLVAGATLVLVGGAAERYHARRFDEHTDRLEQAAARDDQGAIASQIRHFYGDPWVDRAIHVMFWGPVVGLGAIMAGAWLLLSASA